MAPSESLPINALGNIAHSIYCAYHFLFADNDIVEQALELRRHSRIDQCRIGLFENAEQRQSGLSRHDVLSLLVHSKPSSMRSRR